MGTGIERIRIALREAGAPEAIFELEDVYVRAIFLKPAEIIPETQTTQESSGKLKLGERLGEKLGVRLSKNEPTHWFPIEFHEKAVGHEEVVTSLKCCYSKYKKGMI